MGRRLCKALGALDGLAKKVSHALLHCGSMKSSSPSHHLSRQLTRYEARAGATDFQKVPGMYGRATALVAGVLAISCVSSSVVTGSVCIRTLGTST